jgi:predicted nucleic acid-binding protein
VIPFERPYLDACVWVSALDAQEANHEVAAEILQGIEDYSLRILCSTLMPLEVLGGPHPQEPSAAAKAALALQSSAILSIAPGPVIIDRARELRLGFKVGLADAVHLATAIVHEADVFMTWDRELMAKVQAMTDVTIKEPYWFGTPRLK